jgi:hypothetical protein
MTPLSHTFLTPGGARDEMPSFSRRAMSGSLEVQTVATLAGVKPTPGKPTSRWYRPDAKKGTTTSDFYAIAKFSATT